MSLSTHDITRIELKLKRVFIYSKIFLETAICLQLIKVYSIQIKSPNKLGLVQTLFTTIKVFFSVPTNVSTQSTH